MSYDPGFAAALASLFATPKIQSGLHALKNALPFAAGPLGATPRLTPGYKSNTGGSLGATTGNFARNALLGTALDSAGGIGAMVASGMQEPVDPIAQLYQNLVNQLQQPVNAPTGIDTADLMNQVKAAINPIYDAREAVARRQGAQGQADITGLYKQLAQDYKDLAPQQVAQSKDAQKQISDLYGQLRSNIEGSYSRISQEQADQFKQLGIQDALPTVLDKQAPAVADATTAAAQNQASQQQRYMDIGQMDSTYYREGSPNALMRGNEEANRLIGQLQDYIQQTEGDRASGIQSGYLQQLGQAQNALAQQQQAASQETARRQEMLWQMLQSQLNAKNQPQKLTPDTFMGQLPQDVQQSVASAFTSLQRSPEAIYGKVQDPRSPIPGTFVSTTPQWYAAQADKMYQSGQIDAATHQALIMYLQLYFGNGAG